MPIRSMTGYAQAQGEAGPQARFTVALKTVNHRYLDLHFRLPAESEALEMKLRQMLKARLARGHVDVIVSLKEGESALTINRELIAGYVHAFREAAREFSLKGEPDLNMALRLPGALAGAAAAPSNGNFEAAVLAAAEQAVQRLDAMREQEGASLARELNQRIQELMAATEELEKLRPTIVRAQLERLQARVKELVGSLADPSRTLQEAAMLAERSDVQEELVRMKAHCQHFLDLLKQGGEVGKKLDFLLQEMNREANTLLSKSAGVGGDGLRVTGLGLAMRSEIEKAREQAQNIE